MSHTRTHTHTHTHTHIKSYTNPSVQLTFRFCLPGNQEVSAFGGDDHSDSGDNWQVECVSANSQFWQRDDNVRLKHVDTNT